MNGEKKSSENDKDSNSRDGNQISEKKLELNDNNIDSQNVKNKETS